MQNDLQAITAKKKTTLVNFLVPQVKSGLGAVAASPACLAVSDMNARVKSHIHV